MTTRSSAQTSVLSRVLAKNTLLNLSAHGFLFVLALVCIPILVRELKEDVFGLLTLVWTLIGYFSLLDLGVSRAITKFFAQSLAEKKDDELKAIGSTALSSTFAIGVVTGVALFLSSPYLAANVFNLGAEWVDTGIVVFQIAATGLPFVLLFGTSKGILMSAQRFDLVNILQLVSGIGQMGGGVILALSGYGIVEIVLLTVIVRLVVLIGSLIVIRKVFPAMLSPIHAADFNVLRRLLVFGGWVSVSQVISPLFLYLDRILIGAFLSLAAVTYYAVPQEGMARLLVLPLSLTATLFPALSQESTMQGGSTKWESLYTRSVKYLYLASLPLVLLLFGFSEDILTAWIGQELASESAVVFKILSIGLLFNIVAQVPATALLAVGRPDIPAKLHLVELPVMVVGNLVLIQWIGITGAAIMWTGRVTLDAILLLGAVARVRQKGTLGLRLKGLTRALVVQTGIVVMGTAFISLLQGQSGRLAVAAAFVVVYCLSLWFVGLDAAERKFVLDIRNLRIL